MITNLNNCLVDKDHEEYLITSHSHFLDNETKIKNAVITLIICIPVYSHEQLTK